MSSATAALPLTIYHIDAFTASIFGGNPACVIPIPSDSPWPPDSTLLSLAKENAVAETAYFRPLTGSHDPMSTEWRTYHLRWFTPDLEMDLCGHATLATAAVLHSHLGYKAPQVYFQTQSGKLTVQIHTPSTNATNTHSTLDSSDSSSSSSFSFHPSLPVYSLLLPCRPGDSVSFDSLPEPYQRTIPKPIDIRLARDYMLIYQTQEEIESIHTKLDRSLIDQVSMGPGGLIFTAPAKAGPEALDFVSRFFTPCSTIWEDPVTGSAHCTLIPYWAARLGKSSLKAAQISDRGGILDCHLVTDSEVLIAGQAVTYSIGSITLPAKFR